MASDRFIDFIAAITRRLMSFTATGRLPNQNVARARTLHRWFY
ncbi:MULTISPECIES: hypothetical protein [unclassified Caballeronia]|nr:MULTISPECIES: hypothetical protein [unclassified Caballeronia]